jgi:hypothetical protein
MCDVSHDITPLLTSFSAFKGLDIQSAKSIGHLGVVVRDVTDSSGATAVVGDVTLLLKVPCVITEQALVDMRTLVYEVAGLPAPLAVCIIFIGAMFPSICEVIEPSIEYSLGDVCHCWGIVEDPWLKVVEGVGSSQGVQGVVLFPPGVMVQLLEVGQILSQVCDPFMHTLEALYFSVKGLILFPLDGKVNHGGECFCGEEGISLLLCEDPAGVWIFPCPEWV